MNWCLENWFRNWKTKSYSDTSHHKLRLWGDEIVKYSYNVIELFEELCM